MSDISTDCFVSRVIGLLNAPTYAGEIDNYNTYVDHAFEVIESFSDEVRNTIISMLAERVDDVDGVDMRERLLRFIEDHKISDTTNIGL